MNNDEATRLNHLYDMGWPAPEKQPEETPKFVSKGWTFNPLTQEWSKRTGPSTWLVSKDAP